MSYSLRSSSSAVPNVDYDGELHIAQREAYEASGWMIDDANEWMQSDAYADLPQALILDLFVQYGPVEDRLAYWLEEGSQP